ncbi:hypothetical protein SAMN05421805_101717 [Saccharopolyspora antimicrobica]|uniref:Uncharacterized protein n=2 Tax=Saccharopolyspora antimicrobica TaxID=455193 RepID=A0A1I4RWH3_9PSEU|nr:hypothetical protein ATL45_7614 [Saccharopolyspora antimicrobica]SFM56350.1 hypothetical protein SAMN05421805_101717 [Saccharopolyspora antimicrobica]
MTQLVSVSTTMSAAVLRASCLGQECAPVPKDMAPHLFARQPERSKPG